MHDIKPKEIAMRIRNKVRDLNDELLLAAILEVDVEFAIRTDRGVGDATELQVWCSQEI